MVLDSSVKAEAERLMHLESWCERDKPLLVQVAKVDTNKNHRNEGALAKLAVGLRERTRMDPDVERHRVFRIADADPEPPTEGL